MLCRDALSLPCQRHFVGQQSNHGEQPTPSRDNSPTTLETVRQQFPPRALRSVRIDESRTTHTELAGSDRSPIAVRRLSPLPKAPGVPRLPKQSPKPPRAAPQYNRVYSECSSSVSRLTNFSPATSFPVVVVLLSRALRIHSSSLSWQRDSLS